MERHNKVTRTVSPVGPLTTGGIYSMRLVSSIGSSAPKRKSTGKRLRFEVFKRDYFTCRYCGAQPPDVVLVADHVVAVADGGPSTLDNLITACEPCNQGKAARSLGDVLPRTDADLLYLTTQQEIAEMRRYQAAVAARDQAVDEVAADLLARYYRICGSQELKLDTVRSLLNSYDIEVVGFAMDNVANKVLGGYVKYWKSVPYLWAVARNHAAEVED